MHKRQLEVINYIADQIKDITLIDTDPRMNDMFDTNVFFGCLEAAMRILIHSENENNVAMAEKIKKFIHTEILPSMNAVKIDFENIKIDFEDIMGEHND